MVQKLLIKIPSSVPDDGLTLARSQIIMAKELITEKMG